jgi:hypothetical protein
MKKFFYLLTITLIVGSVSLSAQDFAKKGIWEFGGTVGFNSTTFVFDGESGDDALTTFWFNPYLGYFIINGFEIGLIPSFSTSSFGDVSSTDFGILFAPAWNFDLHNCWYPFIEGRIGYNTSSYDDGDSETEDPSSSGLQWGVRGGVKAQVGRNALVNFGIFYEQVTMDPEDTPYDRIGYNQFGIEAGVSIFIP